MYAAAAATPAASLSAADSHFNQKLGSGGECAQGDTSVEQKKKKLRRCACKALHTSFPLGARGMSAKTVIVHLSISAIDQVATCALHPIDLDPVLPFEVTGVFISTASHFLPFFFPRRQTSFIVSSFGVAICVPLIANIGGVAIVVCYTNVFRRSGLRGGERHR